MLRSRSRGLYISVFLVAGLLAPVTSPTAEPARSANRALLELQEAATAPLSVVWAPELGAATVIRAPAGVLLETGRGDPVSRARSFLERFGAAFNVEGASSISVAGRSRDAAGGVHVRFEQRRGGVPVYGALLTVRLSATAVVSVAGAFAPVKGVPVQPTIPGSVARETAALEGEAGDPELTILHEGLISRTTGGSARLTWAVQTRTARAVTLLFVDAAHGAVLDRLPLSHDALDRVVTIPTDEEARKEGDPPHALPAVNNLYDFTGESYRLYHGALGRDAHDGEGAQMRANYVADTLCPNAWWDGTSTSYCPGLDTDDVVGHEWAHAYTQHTHALIYRCQSGALNESYSDIIGESLDLLNGRDGHGGSANDRPWPFGQRWLVGEDIAPSQGYVGRDMWDPQRVGDPGKVSETSSACAGVHDNSGISNHAYAMLVDGAAYNGYTIDGIGMVKALHVYLQAMLAYQGPSTTFAEHQESLLASCDDLLGIDLRRPLTGDPSGEVLTPHDCAQVRAATDSVEMGLWRRAVIIGKVTSAFDARPLDDIEVRLSGSGGAEHETDTDPDGTYRFEGLPGDSYGVFFDGAPAYVAQWWSNKPDRASADPVVLPENGTAIGIDAALVPVAYEPPTSPLISAFTVDREEQGPAGGLPIRDLVTVVVQNPGEAAYTGLVRVSICPDVGPCAQNRSAWTELPPGEAVSFAFDWRARAYVGTAVFQADLIHRDGGASAWQVTYVEQQGDSVAADHSLTYRQPADG